MIRVVLVGYSETQWKLFRQPQWMAEVRRDPQASTLPKRYFDIEEAAYKQALDGWNNQNAGSHCVTAVEFLTKLGAIEIVRS
jgi:hypothetical protein